MAKQLQKIRCVIFPPKNRKYNKVLTSVRHNTTRNKTGGQHNSQSFLFSIFPQYWESDPGLARQVHYHWTYSQHFLIFYFEKGIKLPRLVSNLWHSCLSFLSCRDSRQVPLHPAELWALGQHFTLILGDFKVISADALVLSHIGCPFEVLLEH